MSYRKYATPLLLALKPSRIATTAYSFAAFLTLSLVLFIPLAMPFKALLFIGVLGAVGYVLLVEWQLLPGHSLSAISWSDGNQWQLISITQVTSEAYLLPNSVNTRYFVILNFKANGRRFVKSQVLFQDSVDAELLRKLKVRLRVQASVID